MITRLLFKNLPFELNELILLYTGEYGLNVIFGYEKNIKKIIQKNYLYSQKQITYYQDNYDDILSSAIQYNLPYQSPSPRYYNSKFFIKSIKCNSTYWINIFLKRYEINIDIFYLITSKGDYNLFDKCYLQSKPDLNKNVQHKLLNIVCKKGYVKMLDYFIQNLKFKISHFVLALSKKKCYLERAIYYKRKNIVKYLTLLN